MMIRRITCPYCFRKFAPGALAFRCTNKTPTACAPVADVPLQRYRRLTSPILAPPVIAGRGGGFFLPTSATCGCGTETRAAVCPECHNELPSRWGHKPSRIIALVGAKEAGKSHYVAVLVHELKNRIGPRFKRSLGAKDDETIRRYNTEFKRFVYDEKVTLNATDGARTAGASVRNPMVYGFARTMPWWQFSGFGWPRPLWPFGGRDETVLVFFDTAGEDLNAFDIMSTEAQYIANADALIFLIDPLQITSVRDRVDISVPLPERNTDPQDIVGRVSRLIREIRGISPAAKIRTPVALAFSKIDAVRPLIDPSSPIHRASTHDGFFDVSDAEQVNDSIRAHVAEWAGQGLDSFLEHDFTTFAYFGLSALGASPEDGRLTNGVAPFRVDDPFLWILYKLGLVDGRRSRRP